MSTAGTIFVNFFEKSISQNSTGILRTHFSHFCQLLSKYAKVGIAFSNHSQLFSTFLLTFLKISLKRFKNLQKQLNLKAFCISTYVFSAYLFSNFLQLLEFLRISSNFPRYYFHGKWSGHRTLLYYYFRAKFTLFEYSELETLN